MEALTQQLDDQRDENKTLKRRHAANVKVECHSDLTLPRSHEIAKSYILTFQGLFDTHVNCDLVHVVQHRIIFQVFPSDVARI